MFTGLCNPGAWGSLERFGEWGWIGLILNLFIWFSLLAGLILLVVRVIRRFQIPAATGQPTAKEILQAQYARGEITREQYELKKRDIG